LPQRVLDPLERTSEILFGIIMVLTFTGSISVADGGRENLRTLMWEAIGCNVAWGMVDAVMYLMAAFISRARLSVTLRAIREAAAPATAHGLIAELLPDELSSVLTAGEVEHVRQRLKDRPSSSPRVTLTRTDFIGAAGVFLLVFLSTLPVAVPLMVVRGPQLALRLSNAVALLMLFFAGWSLGRHSGRPAWRSGLAMMGIGLVLVAITIALGG
jgi:VIT1/CCC1 family predicted Fe2+/Mn2+ transporter